MKTIPKKITIKDQIRESLLAMTVGGDHDMYPVDNKNFNIFYQMFMIERKKMQAENLGEWICSRTGSGTDEMFIIVRIK